MAPPLGEASTLAPLLGEGLKGKNLRNLAFAFWAGGPAVGRSLNLGPAVGRSFFVFCFQEQLEHKQLEHEQLEQKQLEQKQLEQKQLESKQLEQKQLKQKAVRTKTARTKPSVLGSYRRYH